MFDNWTPSDWIGFAGLAFVVVGAALGVAWRLGQRLDRVESKQANMSEKIAELDTAVTKIPSLDTAMQLMAQGMTTMQSAFVDMRAEIREDRIETRDQIREIGHDVKNLLTGKVQPARRAGSRSSDRS